MPRRYWFMGGLPKPPSYTDQIIMANAYKWCKTPEDFALADLLGMKVVISTGVDGWELRALHQERKEGG